MNVGGCVLERPLGATMQAKRNDRRCVAEDIEEAIWSRVDETNFADAGHQRDRARDYERAQNLVAPVGSDIGEADVDLRHALSSSWSTMVLPKPARPTPETHHTMSGGASSPA